MKNATKLPVSKTNPAFGRAKLIHSLAKKGETPAKAFEAVRLDFDCSQSLFNRIWKRNEIKAKLKPRLAAKTIARLKKAQVAVVGASKAKKPSAPTPAPAVVPANP